MPRPTAQVAPYVAARGVEQAMLFLLSFGGAELSLAKTPTAQSATAKLLGYDAAKALAARSSLTMPQPDHAAPGAARQALARRNAGMAQRLAAQNNATAEIARSLRVSDNSVRRWLKEAKG